MGAGSLVGSGRGRRARPPSSDSKRGQDPAKPVRLASAPVASGGGWQPFMDEPNTFVCRFCGGAKCKREDWTRQGGTGAIRGLHSDWVTPDILACQRPSTRLIKEYGLIDVFLKHNIRAVFNLQQSGEHPLCGDGINESGFSYYPQEFMKNDIFYYAFGWVDFGTPSLDHMLNIAQVMDFTIQRGQRLAVHCHAGLGRTGLAVACYLVYAGGVSPGQAIQATRKKRPGSLQTREQTNFVHHFAEYVRALRLVFTDVGVEGRAYLLPNLVSRQSRLLHGLERRRNLHVPRVIKTICQRLVRAARREGKDGGGGQGRVTEAFLVSKSWTGLDEEHLRNIKRQINSGDLLGVESAKPAHLAQLLVDWLQSLAEPLIPQSALTKVLLVPDADADRPCRVVDLDVIGSRAPCLVYTLDCIVRVLLSLSEDTKARQAVYTRVGRTLLRLQADEPTGFPCARDHLVFAQPAQRETNWDVPASTTRTAQIGAITKDLLIRWRDFFGRSEDSRGSGTAAVAAVAAADAARKRSAARIRRQMRDISSELSEEGTSECAVALPNLSPPIGSKGVLEDDAPDNSERARRDQLKAGLLGRTFDLKQEFSRMQGSAEDEDGDMNSFIAKRTCELFMSLSLEWQATVINQLMSAYGKNKLIQDTPKMTGQVEGRRSSLPPIFMGARASTGGARGPSPWTNLPTSASPRLAAAPPPRPSRPPLPPSQSSTATLKTSLTVNTGLEESLPPKILGRVANQSPYPLNTTPKNRRVIAPGAFASLDFARSAGLASPAHRHTPRSTLSVSTSAAAAADGSASARGAMHLDDGKGANSSEATAREQGSSSRPKSARHSQKGSPRPDRASPRPRRGSPLSFEDTLLSGVSAADALALPDDSDEDEEVMK